jgi:DNA-binding PadR family transcriptional regulator
MLTDLALHVLLAVGRGASHGYAIGKEIEQQSGGRLDPSTGALYQAIKRLTDDGLLRPAAAPVGAEVDPRRKYFALTALGKREVGQEIARLESLVELARSQKLYHADSRR